jgi:3-oxoacyl-[acyl-carrier protein] reductase
VHVLINNTGGPAAGTVYDAPPEVRRRLPPARRRRADRGAGAGARHAQGRLRPDHQHHLDLGEGTDPGLGVSNTIRAAMASWAKTLSRELAPDGITVNNVLPGFTSTERLDYLFRLRAEKSGGSVEEIERAALAQVPAGRFARPEEIAWAVGFLASPQAAYINGINVPVDGGRMASL